VTLVALPPNVLPATVTGAVPQVLPEEELRTTAGVLIHPHDTGNMVPTVVQTPSLLTAIK
jgi:hypothetical protein